MSVLQYFTNARFKSKMATIWSSYAKFQVKVAGWRQRLIDTNSEGTQSLLPLAPTSFSSFPENDGLKPFLGSCGKVSVVAK